MANIKSKLEYRESVIGSCTPFIIIIIVMIMLTVTIFGVWQFWMWFPVFGVLIAVIATTIEYFTKGSIKICPKCGKRLEGTSQFCNNCGMKIISKCPSCGATVGGEAKFCERCGQNLGDVIIPSTPIKIEKGKFCPECSNEVNPNAKFCLHCGARL